MNTILIIWFTLTALSFIYVCWHNLAKNPVSWVQKLAWILVTAYAGPIGLLAYWHTCRTRKRMTHEESTMATWKQAANSEMHCLAGDATGIIISAAIVYHFALPNGIDLIIEYCSGFVVGLFIFQALMMISMYQGNYFLAVRKTFFAETVSMNMVMTGMIPLMVVLMHFLPEGDSPYNPNFWFTMGMASIAGGVIAYPINYWLVAKKLKHGCMTLGPKEQQVHASHSSHSSSGAKEGSMEGMASKKGSGHEMGSLPFATAVLYIAGTYAILFLVTYLTTYIAPVTFR